MSRYPRCQSKGIPDVCEGYDLKKERVYDWKD